MCVVFLRMMCPFGDNESGDISHLENTIYIDENFLDILIQRQHYTFISAHTHTCT